jgi:hypothetical protein
MMQAKIVSIIAFSLLLIGNSAFAALSCPYIDGVKNYSHDVIDEDLQTFVIADPTDTYLCKVKKPNNNYVSEICIEAGTLLENGISTLWVRTSEIDKDGRLLQTGYMNKAFNYSPGILARVRNSRRFISATQNFVEPGHTESLRLDKRRLTYRFQVDNRNPKLRTKYSGNCSRK